MREWSCFQDITTTTHISELLRQQLQIAQGPKDLRKLQKLPGGARRALERAAEFPVLYEPKIYKNMASQFQSLE